MRRASWALLLAALMLASTLISRFAGWLSFEFYSFEALVCSLFLYLTLAVPYMMLAVALLLSPMLTFLWFDSPSYPMTHQWWFWLHVLVALFAGGCALSLAGRKYPGKDETEL